MNSKGRQSWEQCPPCHEVSIDVTYGVDVHISGCVGARRDDAGRKEDDDGRKENVCRGPEARWERADGVGRAARYRPVKRHSPRRILLVWHHLLPRSEVGP
jgi:hypothetical protein